VKTGPTYGSVSAMTALARNPRPLVSCARLFGDCPLVILLTLAFTVWACFLVILGLSPPGSGAPRIICHAPPPRTTGSAKAVLRE